ncbi:MAG: hypothetical protein COA57_06580 [Flavobacteriales bacterium]|nr:response regulator [Bacteroidales bacterium AH-315-I05]PCJ86179.1 MAG: hypothetical protein COA57_06580 [Flavobacteriales bacterium]
MEITVTDSVKTHTLNDNAVKQPLKFNSVIIIDDNELDLFITEKLLCYGATVNRIQKEKDPLDALESIKINGLPDLILLDVHMPAICGFRFLDTLKEFCDDIRSKTKIVLMSAFFLHEPELKKKAASCPFIYRFMDKPLEVEKLI